MHDTIVRLADVWKTCNKIRAAAFRVGLNLWDWYRPLDPEGNSLISESKFVSVLAGPLRSVIGLSEDEIAQLADYFRAQDGRVLYHQLCQVIHGEDAGAGGARAAAECALEACPAPAAPRCRRLDAWQARRLCCLLATIAQRDIPFRPYFQDYELVAKNDGRITFAHFARILNFVGVLVSPEDFNLLVRRYIKDSYTIDYVEFLREIEAVKKDGIQGLGPEYQHPNAMIDTRPSPTPPLPRMPGGQVPAGGQGAAGGRGAPPARDLVELMLRVQRHVLERRVRVSEFFRDYDPLSGGRISAAQFVRALDAAGLRAAPAALSAADARRLAACYADAADPARVCWRTFEDDCDQVFTIKELEKHPTVMPGAGAAMAAGAGARGAGEGESEGGREGEEVLSRVRARCTERSLDLRPMFRDHDKAGTGHVSHAQWERVAGALGVAGEDAAALAARYRDGVGVDYYALLRELEDEPEEVSPPSAALAPGRRARAPPPAALTDIVQILAKIKGKIVREGVRPQQFLQQFDRGRAGLVTRAQFQRGLAAAALPLHPLELDTLMEVFSAPGRRQAVEYGRFCSCVGGALTQEGAERAPLVVSVPHAAPPPPAPPTHLDHEERALLARALDKLTKFPDRTSNLFDIFKEADRSNSGRVSRAQTERALARSDVLTLLSSRERDLLYKCFGCAQHGSDEVNYRALCNTLDVLHATSSAQPC